MKLIPVGHAFQVIGVDMPLTYIGNRYVIVFQDLFTKWPMVFAVSYQKATWLAKVLVEETVPMLGAPKALLSDLGAIFNVMFNAGCLYAIKNPEIQYHC